jgi:hypothetical protein
VCDIPVKKKRKKKKNKSIRIDPFAFTDILLSSLSGISDPPLTEIQGV